MLESRLKKALYNFLGLLFLAGLITFIASGSSSSNSKVSSSPSGSTSSKINISSSSSGSSKRKISSNSSLPVVAIRLDDVQAWWCVGVADRVVSAILDANASVSIGLIGSNLDKDPVFDTWLKRISLNENVEVASHSYAHIPYGNNPEYWQRDDLGQANDIINAVLPGTVPKSFIPPENSYDDSTGQALEYWKFSIMSAECTWSFQTGQPIYCPPESNVVAPNIAWNDIYMLPAGAVLGDTNYWEDYQLPASVELATSWIEAQIKAQGFSVLMLHPEEFAHDPKKSDCSIVNEDKIQVLVDLIQSGYSKWQFSTFQNAVETIVGAGDKKSIV